MLIYDGIVFSLQRAGGISVLFTELLTRLPSSAYELVGHRVSSPTQCVGNYRYLRPRFLERYRRARTPTQGDLFHSTYYRLPEARGVRTVTTVFDFVYERYATPHRRVLHSLQKKRAVAQADAVICISEHTRRDLIEFVGHSAAAKARVIHLGVSSCFSPLAGAIVRPQVLFVGSRAAYKNFTAAVLAIAPLSHLSLVCVGGGSFSATESALLERHIPGRYRAAGYISAEDLNIEYNKSLCLVYPSHYEGFGIPILEAMRAGCPVIALNQSSIPEVAGEAALLLNSGTPEDIRVAISSLEVSSTRERFVRLGKLRASLFSWDAMYEKTIALYEDLTGRSISGC